MAEWKGSARTNYVHVKDIDGLREAIEPFDLKADPHHSCRNYWYITVGEDSDHGGWPGTVEVEDDEGDVEEVEFDFAEHVIPFLHDGEVLIAMECGAEKLRYLTGYAQAYMKRGDEVLTHQIGLAQIYAQAAKAFAVPLDTIAECMYENTPAFLDYAARGDLAALVKVVNEGLDLVSHQDELVRRATANGMTDILDYLIEKGVDPNHQEILQSRNAAVQAWVQSRRLAQITHGVVHEASNTMEPAGKILRRQITV